MASPSKEARARYRERHREKLRAWNREYAARKRREAGMPELGSPESRANRSAARKASGAEHGNWKGDKAGYGAIHAWVALHKTRRGQCETCGDTRRTTFANVSGEYRRDTSDYAELCYSCHKLFDLERLGRRAAS